MIAKTLMNSINRSRGLVLFPLMALASCTVATDEDAQTEESTEPSAKAPVTDKFGAGKADSIGASSILILGKMLDHQKQTASYTNTPKYRAFTFLGKSGDQPVIEVTSGNGDAVAWLLDMNQNVVAFDDDGGEGTNSLLKGKALPADGTYQIVFRNYTEKAADFTVSLNGSGHSTGEPTLEGVSVWDDAWTLTPKATQAELIAHFSPGSSTRELKGGWAGMRHRTCNVATGCRNWTLVDGVYFYERSFPNYTLWEKQSPKTELRTDSSRNIYFGCDAQNVSDVYWYPGGFTCSNGSIDFTTVEAPDNYLNIPVSTAHVPVTVHQGYGHGRSEVYESKVDADGRYLQVQYAFFAKIVESAPTPAFTK